MAYQGPERRHHRVFVTRNTEYHVRGKRCVAVRGAVGREWHSDHSAIGKEILGGIAVLPNGSYQVSFGQAEAGQKLYFDNDLVTTPVLQVARPGESTARSYPQ